MRTSTAALALVSSLLLAAPPPSSGFFCERAKGDAAVAPVVAKKAGGGGWMGSYSWMLDKLKGAHGKATAKATEEAGGGYVILEKIKGASRATGRFAAEAVDKVRTTGIAANETLSAGASKVKEVGSKVKEFDEEHKVSERTKETLSAGASKVREVGSKVKEFDEKHKVSERARETARVAVKEVDEGLGVSRRTREATHAVGSKAKEIDERHRVSERTREAARVAGERTAEFERRHHLGERALAGIRDGASFLIERLREATGQSVPEGNSAAVDVEVIR